MKPFPCKTGLHRKVRETKRRVLIPCLLAAIPLFTASLLAAARIERFVLVTIWTSTGTLMAQSCLPSTFVFDTRS